MRDEKELIRALEEAGKRKEESKITGDGIREFKFQIVEEVLKYVLGETDQSPLRGPRLI